ncbi:MAG TPA: dihydroorotate dehydrogenase electron transfer subunit [Nitrososphaeraceae archaeon]|nr:dihydroorotate dehydrogenase electron transfer subunit [Nitrososphaeraceae archaeon]
MEFHTSINNRRIVRIEETVSETATVKTLVFKDDLSYTAKPGQFLMIWIPRIEEIPMSVMINSKEGYAAVTIRKSGIGSTALFERKKGDLIGLRGPYGNEFIIRENYKKILIIGGGTGLVPLLRLASYASKKKLKITIVLGAKTKKEVFFEKMAKKLTQHVDSSVKICTDDGSYGLKGTTVNVMSNLVRNNTFDCVYTCGPELMMRGIVEIANKNSIPVQASLERYMKCGIGICGSCCLDSMLVCQDGTVFNGKQLSKILDFGISYRDKDGQKIRYNQRIP